VGFAVWIGGGAITEDEGDTAGLVAGEAEVTGTEVVAAGAVVAGVVVWELQPTRAKTIMLRIDTNRKSFLFNSFPLNLININSFKWTDCRRDLLYFGMDDFHVMVNVLRTTYWEVNLLIGHPKV